MGYTFFGKDSVSDFNDDMQAQCDALIAANATTNPLADTLAPDNNWANYIDLLNTTIAVGTGTGQYQLFRPIYSSRKGGIINDAGYAAGVEYIGFTQQTLSYRNESI